MSDSPISLADERVWSSPERLHRLVRCLDVEAVDGCGFPADVFVALLQEHRCHGGVLDGARLEDVGVEGVPALDDAAADETVQAGRTTFASGENAVVLLCGGMATRFGGTVKALADVLPGHRFIDAAIEKIRGIGEAFGAPIPVVVVTSAASHRAIGRHLAACWADAAAGGWLRLVRQRVFPRVLADGGLPMPSADLPLLYPPGHGDVLTSLAEHDIAGWLRDRGVRRVFTWGIDNPLAGPDVRIAAAHLRSGRSVTIEVVRRESGERGGCILRLDGRIEVIEDIRLGAAAAIQSTLLNTNSMVIDTDVLAGPPELTFFAVEKRLAGQTVVQFERLLGELTTWIDCNLLLVPRAGENSRFAPIKTPEDLKKYASALGNLSGARKRRRREENGANLT